MQATTVRFDGSAEFAAKFEEWVNREAEAFARKDAIVLGALNREIRQWIEGRFSDINQPCMYGEEHLPKRPGRIVRFLANVFAPVWHQQMVKEQNTALPYFWARRQRDAFSERIERHLEAFHDEELYERQMEQVKRQFNRVAWVRNFYGGA